MTFKKVDSKMNFPKMEEEILKFWEEEKIFEKSVSKEAKNGDYIFYDGPPFATGTPHYGHIVGSVMKDVVPRYFTMKGYRVERKWGWDCHGLPIENIAEKELGIKRKKEIEEMGVAKFNEFCQSKVLDYVSEWKKVIRRLGRWADMENAYKTMDLSYMESIWWVFKELWVKGLVYESHRSMHICTRCETTLSQQEVAEGYKDIKDLSCVAKFELINEPGTFVLAWTTTPWTLIGNVALAVGKDIEYVRIKTEDGIFIVAKNLSEKIFANKEFELIEKFIGEELIGKKYKPLFGYYSKKEDLENKENGWQIYAADFVTTEEGTGVVHIAPAFGEDDMNLGKENNLPFIQHVNYDGSIKKEAEDFAGMSVKPIDDHQKTDVEIIRYLAKNNLLFSKEKYEHSYPHCWRCDTPLINYATSSWFVNVSEIKNEALGLAKNINWTPEHIKEGRFGKWLEGARDWSISRQRYWASVIPIWKCECGEIKVIGSVDELEKLSGKKVTDIHKHVVDEIIFSCEKCNGNMKRIPDVLDTWFDSGSMPYAQMHYPFENKEKFEQNFPAEFIAEGQDQCRAWFYYLHVLGTALRKSHAFKNVIVNGIVLAEDGKKMSKRLKNYPDPMEMFEKYGADAVRYYLMSSPVVVAENLNFSEKEVAENVRGMFRMLWNSYSFFVLYASIDNFQPTTEKLQPKNLLDKWIVSELNVLIGEVNVHMEKYELNRAIKLFPVFIDNMSNWYIRRSRKRFWKSEDDGDKESAYQTLHYVLVELSKLMAPFTPFVAEEIYKNLTGNESVHLTDFPRSQYDLMADDSIGVQMMRVRAIVNLGLQLRAKTKINVRQPLGDLCLMNGKMQDEFVEIIKDELNIKNVIQDIKSEKASIIWGYIGEIKVGINTEITEDLKLEGQAREIVRFIQEMRKEAGYDVDNRIVVGYIGLNSVFEKFGSSVIQKEVLANELVAGGLDDFDLEKEFSIEEAAVKISIKR